MESKYFPQNLRYLRETAELSQAELAEKIFVSRTLLVKLETGAAKPTKDHVDALCKYFGVEKDELLNKNLGWDISRKLSVRRIMESKINFVIVIVCLVILVSFVLLLTLPILIEGQDRGYYCTVWTDGSEICYSRYGTTNTNALFFGMNHGNYLALVDLVISSVSFLLGILFFFPKSSRLKFGLLLAFYTLFVVSIILFAVFMVWAVPVSDYEAHILK